MVTTWSTHDQHMINTLINVMCTLYIWNIIYFCDFHRSTQINWHFRVQARLVSQKYFLCGWRQNNFYKIPKYQLCDVPCSLLTTIIFRCWLLNADQHTDQHTDQHDIIYWSTRWSTQYVLINIMINILINTLINTMISTYSQCWTHWSTDFGKWSTYFKKCSTHWSKSVDNKTVISWSLCWSCVDHVLISTNQHIQLSHRL